MLILKHDFLNKHFQRFDWTCFTTHYFATFIKQKSVDAKSEKMARFLIGGFIFFVFVSVLSLKLRTFPEHSEQKSEKMCKNVL